MKIAMFTNTYLPMVGGVSISVQRFTQTFRRWGHRVLIVAPEFEGRPQHEKDTVRVAAIQNFNGSDFSVMLPAPAGLSDALDDFQPEVIHAHHPFLIGNTALREAAARKLPIVFTHHTMWEHYTHYVPLHLKTLRRYVINLSTGFANLCDAVAAPSESVERILRDRGVTVPIRVVPTGVDLEEYAWGDGPSFRRRYGIPARAFVIGTVGRLAPEKNMEFLAQAVAEALGRIQRGRFVVIGSGPSGPRIEEVFRRRGLRDLLILTGTLKGRRLVNAYHGMDAFVFASKTETQGMVLVESLASGTPAVALDAPGAREVIADGSNGRLLADEDEQSFAEAIAWLAHLPPARRRQLAAAARRSTAGFSTDECARKMMDVYRTALQSGPRAFDVDKSDIPLLLRKLRCEWELLTTHARALVKSMTEPGESGP